MFKLLIIVSMLTTVGIASTNHVKVFNDLAMGIYPVKINKKIPFFEAQDMKGKRVTSKVLKNPSLVVFWQPSCPKCKPLLQTMSKLKKRINGKLKFDILTATAVSPEKVMAYFAKNNINLKTIIDSKGLMHKKFGANVTPLTYITDKKTYVRGILPGNPSASMKDWLKLIKFMAKGKR